MKYKLNSGFETFEPFIKEIQTLFNRKSETIHKARNELKVLQYNKIDVVVKSFKVPNVINRVVYSFFKSSKAKKSYDYALKIGDFAPKPIGYIEFYTLGFIQKSYFISEKFDYDFTIREPLLDENFPQKELVLKAFAQFTYLLHESGILHQDYSPGNILIKKNEDTFEFKIVDINRMKFLRLTLLQRLKNFSKLWAKNEDLVIVAKEYAKLMKKDEQQCVDLALNFSQKHKNKINMKKRLKGIEVVD